MKNIPVFFYFKILFGMTCLPLHSQAQALNVQILGNQDFCPGGNTTLDAGSNYATYSWSNGAATRFILVQLGGNYSVTVTDALGRSGSATVTITERPNPTPIITGSLFKCPNRPTALDAGSDYAFYNWSTGETARGIVISEVGDYKVTVTDRYGCQGNTTATVVAGLPVIIDIPSEIRLCGNDTATMNASSVGALSYLWNDNSTDSIKIVRDSGIYNVIVTNGQCVGYDTCKVYQIPPPELDLGNDTILCLGENITLNGAVWGVTDYQWSDGGNGPSRTIWQDGQYKLTIRFGNCFTSDSMTVSIFDKKQGLQLDTVICDTLFKLKPRLAGAIDYRWSTGADTSTIIVQKTGDYRVRISNRKCHVDWDYKLTFKKFPNLDLGKDTIICLDQANHYTLKADWALSSVKWQDSSTFATYVTEYPGGSYKVKVSNECGVQLDSISVRFHECNTVYVPNAFTPNGDNMNDIFQIYPATFVKKFNYFKIFERTGNLIYSAVDFNPEDALANGWNGNFGGSAMRPDVYIYVLEFASKDGKVWVQSGDVTLVK
jgi:gliding motility-associated-like protein